jgi:hypothetical protein
VPYAAPAAAPAPAGYVPPGGYLPAGGAAPAAGYAPPAGYAQPGGYNSPPFGTSPPFGSSPPFGATAPLGGMPGPAGPPQYPVGAPPASRPRRKTGLIVGLSVAVLAAAGIGTGVALSGSSSKPPVQPGGNGGGQQRALSYTMATMTAPLRAPGNNTAEAAFSQDGKLLVTDEFDNKLTVDSFFVWDTATRKHVRTLSLPGDYVSASNPVISADDQSVTEMAIRSYPTPAPVQVYRWDLTTGQRTTALTVSSPEKTWSAVYATTSLSGDGSKLLVEAASGHGIDVWDVSGGQKITTLTQPGASAIVGDVISADGSVAGVGDADGHMYVWDTAAQQLKGTFHYTYKAPVKDGIPTFPGLSPDGKQVIVFGNGGPVTLWDVATEANVTPRDARWAAQRGWQYSPDGMVIATEGETPARVELWDAATRAHLFTIPFTGGVRAWVYAISGDDKELFTVGVDAKGSDTGVNYLWNLR